VDQPPNFWNFIRYTLFLPEFTVQNPKTSFLRVAQAIDWLGILFVLCMSLMTLLGLNLGGVISPWGSPKLICLVVFGFFMSIIFILYETRFVQNPIMPMQILRRRSNVASLLVCFMHSMSICCLVIKFTPSR